MKIIWNPCKHETNLHPSQQDEAKRLLSLGCPACPAEFRAATSGEVVRDTSDDPVFNESAEVIKTRIAELQERLAQVDSKADLVTF
jgi:hypothetical protein